MVIDIDTIDPNRNISNADINCLVQAIDYFDKNITLDDIQRSQKGQGILFQRITKPVLDQIKSKKFLRSFKFDKELIFQSQLTASGAEQTSALQTYCRRSGLIDNDKAISLSQVGKKILNKEISIEEYAFFYLSKQSVYVDDNYKIHLLSIISNIAQYSAVINEQLILDEITKLLNPGPSDKINFRFDLFCNLMMMSEIVTSVDDEYEFTMKCKPVLDAIYASKNTFGSLDKDDIHSIGSFSGGIFDIVDQSNVKIFQAVYPNLFKEWNHSASTRITYNKIYYGAPGTGKTFRAKKEAMQMVSLSLSKWSEIPEEYKEHLGFVQFHPSYDYTDFVEGLRPDENGSFVRRDGVFKSFCKIAALSSSNDFFNVYKKLIYKIQSKTITTYPTLTGQLNKIFVNDQGEIYYQTGDHPRHENIANIKLLYDYFLDNQIYDLSNYDRTSLENILSKLTDNKVSTLDPAEYKWTLQQLLSSAKNSNLPFVFIIDEINRGELSKIFGELFYSIEPDYRGVEGRVKTQYNNMVSTDDIFYDGFYIPENVYIIGTMNDIDRGVESMDFAIRRRFIWEEITADQSIVEMGITHQETIDRIHAINKALEEEHLSSAYYLGGAYFRNIPDNDYETLWEERLKGVITEYFRGDYDLQDKMKRIKTSYDSWASINRKDTDKESKGFEADPEDDTTENY